MGERVRERERKRMKEGKVGIKLLFSTSENDIIRIPTHFSLLNRL